MTNWKKWLAVKLKLNSSEKVITPIETDDSHIVTGSIQLTIDITDENIRFEMKQNTTSAICAYKLAKLMIDLENGNPIMIQGLMEVMPENEISNLILQHYLSMRERPNRPCISPAEIFNVNRAQDFRE